METANGLRYSAADKLKAVKLYLEEGYQVKAIARELGIGKNSLGNGAGNTEKTILPMTIVLSCGKIIY